MAWDASTRRERLPGNWEELRTQVRRRARGRCEGISIDGEPYWHAPGCARIGSDCDHDQPGDNHALDNLRWLSSTCHLHKTHADNRKRREALKLTREEHPMAALLASTRPGPPSPRGGGPLGPVG